MNDNKIDLSNFKPVVDIGDFGEIAAPKNDKTLLVDADTIAYTAALSAIEEDMLLPEDMYLPEEWQQLMTEGKYDSATGVLKRLDFELARKNFEDKLDRIKLLTGSNKVELHFSVGRKGFRYKVDPQYKANRDPSVVPPNLEAFKYSLQNSITNENYSFHYHEYFEADDAVVALKNWNINKYILCAIDKDVLNSCPGKHFNYYESYKFNKSMKWVETSEFEAFKWPFVQAIMGDNSDGIIGLKGYGPKKAEKFIDKLIPNEKHFDTELLSDILHSAIIELYEKNKRTKEDYIKNFNLVSMSHIDMNYVKPWSNLLLLEYNDRLNKPTFNWVVYNTHDYCEWKGCNDA